MSKMGQEFEKNLDNAKYDLYRACKHLLEWSIGGVLDVDALSEINKAIAKVEGLDIKK